MRVSVAMATFNGGKYIREQIRSIVAQSRPPDEIVICDDASLDDTVEACEQALRGFEGRTVFLRNPANRGLVTTFERALASVTGDVVFLSDQDDSWYPEKVATILRAFDGLPDTDVLIHDLDFCDANLVPFGQRKLERFGLLEQDSSQYVTGMATALRRRFLDVALPIPADLPGNHDDWLHTLAQALGTRQIVHVPLAAYRRHDANATASSTINAPQRLASATAIQHLMRRYALAMGSRHVKLRRRLHAREVTVDRLHVIRDEDRWPTPVAGRVREARLAELASEIASLRTRVGALNHSRRIRLPHLARAWRAGVYGHAAGIKSLFLDFLAKGSPK